jgi:hypothetical protein
MITIYCIHSITLLLFLAVKTDGFFLVSKASSANWKAQNQSLKPDLSDLNSRSILLLTNTNDIVTDSMLSDSVNIGVFVTGLIPFIWATIEFWRRIAIGKPFGTGKDSVFIGEDMDPSSSRGRRTLGRGALIIAYILFAAAAFFIFISLYSVLTTGNLSSTTN